MKASWLLLCLLAVQFLNAESRKPNVVFIAIDDLRINLGCYGDPLAQTPHLDKLAGRGTTFLRAYSQFAVCNPSRASVMTGLRPDRTKVWEMRTHFREIIPDVVTLPQHFKTNGYHTEAIGKIYHDPPYFRDPASWSVPAQLDDTRSVRGKYAAEANLRYYQPDGKMGDEKVDATESADVPDDAYIDGRVADLAVERLGQLAGSSHPFFLAIGIRRPHLPFSAPQRYWDMYDPKELGVVPQPSPPAGAPAIAAHDSAELRGYRDMPDEGDWTPEQVTRLRHGYYAATSFADAQIGRVLAAVDSLGLAKNTVVVVWSDHGFHLGEHGLWTKKSNYEVDVRVPLIVAAPNGKPTGVRSEALVELVDLYPTLTELCGLPAPRHVDGRSFVPNLGDAAASGKPGAVSQFPRPWNRGSTTFEQMGYTVRTATHRYVEWRKIDSGEITARELYSYDHDPLFEQTNLAEDFQHAETVARHAALLAKVVGTSTR